MNNKLFNVAMFAIGAAVGSVVTWKIMKDRCERMIQDEVDAFKKDWVKITREDDAKYTVDEEDGDDPDDYDEDDEYDDDTYSEYRTLAHSYDHNYEEGGGDEVPYVNGPQVISPDEFGSERDFEAWCLSYYKDGVLADDWQKQYDIEETIGEDALEHFGDYAEDIVHVRNERLQCDYEVTRDPRKFADIIANDPHMSGYAD